jgi:hypothetical protein
MKKKLLATCAACILPALAIGPATADAVLWIDDTSGNIGTVDLTTSTTTVVGPSGQILTDIGFNSSGALFGTTFGNFYSVSQTTGHATQIGGAYSGTGGMNALVGNGSNLLGAANDSFSIFSINGTTGANTAVMTSPLTSAGDLAFATSGHLFESAVNGSVDALVDVTANHVVGNFNQGATTFNGVFGLAVDPTTGTMYAVNGTQIYTVNEATAAVTPLLNYSGHGLGAANGTAFIGEGSVVGAPEPASVGILGFGVGVMAFLRRRRRRATSAAMAV